MHGESHNDRKRAAIVYDFDGTLAEGNIQEAGFIPDIGMEKEDFWLLVKERAKKHDGDEILIYMQLMLEKARAKGLSVTRELLRRHGRQAKLYEGLASGAWFRRMNEFGAAKGLDVEHYVVSSGLEEMINGCPIAGYFKRVFGSKFAYDNDVASWPAVAINYITKTQYLFRINKGIDNHWDRERINAFTVDERRPVPFSRMIFLGDGDTDIPAMKMVTHQQGHAIAVYHPDTDKKEPTTVHTLLADGRVSFVAPADYRLNSPLDIIVKGVLGRMAR